MATANGGLPSRTAGITKPMMTENVNPRPNKAVSPRQRPKAMTDKANAANNSQSWLPLWWSMMAYWDSEGFPGE